MSAPIRISVETADNGPIQIGLRTQPTVQQVEVSAPIIQKQTTPEYEGPYTVTPSLQQQTLETEGLKMTDDVTVEAMQRATLKDSALFPVQATLTVSSSGRVSASGSRTVQFQPIKTDGYATTSDQFPATAVATGYTDLPTEAGKTVTPTEQEQTAVESQKYTTGEVKIAPIPVNYGKVTQDGAVLSIE